MIIHIAMLMYGCHRIPRTSYHTICEPLLWLTLNTDPGNLSSFFFISLSLDVITLLYVTCIYRNKKFSHTVLSIQGRRRTGPSDRSPAVAPTPSKLNHLYGVKAWRSWVQQRNKQHGEREPQLSLLVLILSSPPTHCDLFNSALTVFYGIVSCSQSGGH